ncbi:STAS domain-containing protein [Streptomyces sp. NPDC097617]|uniref:STAS domain-containing protein n=1 Tax=Streptomyces sp. NPDC097617 TaxID=3366091 RepID=UPI0038280712
MSPPDDRGPHSVTVATRVDCTVITVAGDIDLDHVDALNTALLGACAGPGAPERVVVDVARLAFCDSAGLNTLLRARALCEENERTLILADPGPQLLRLLSITGADLLFNLDVPGSGEAGGAREAGVTGDGTTRAAS